jgi:hypothetical protein
VLTVLHGSGAAWRPNGGTHRRMGDGRGTGWLTGVGTAARHDGDGRVAKRHGDGPDVGSFGPRRPGRRRGRDGGGRGEASGRRREAIGRAGRGVRAGSARLSGCPVCGPNSGNGALPGRPGAARGV